MPTSTRAAVDWREQFWDFENRIYLDCANQGLFPTVALRAVQEALELKKYPERLTNEYYFELPAQTRAALARLTGVRPTEIALTSGASDGVNAVATGLPFQPGDEILLPEREFPSNYYPWKHLERRGVRVREVAPAAGGRFVTTDDLLAATSERTRLVAASFVTYDTASRLDAARLCEECRRLGIFTFLDASQAVGSLAVDVNEIGCDFLVSCGYKWLLSPYGTGFFYLREELISRLEVHYIRWMALPGARDFNRLPRPASPESGPGWQLEPDARRWDVAEVSNFINLSAMKASVEFLLRVGVETIERHAVNLCEQLRPSRPGRPLSSRKSTRSSLMTLTCLGLPPGVNSSERPTGSQ